MVAEVDVSSETKEKLTEIRDAVESATGERPSEFEILHLMPRRALKSQEFEEFVEESAEE